MSSSLPSQRKLTHDRLIIGEGESDSIFLQAFCENRHINGFQIMPSKGLDGFGQMLDALAGYSNIGILKSLALVIDADEDPLDNLRRVQRQLNDRHHPRPDDVLQRADPNGNVSYSVTIIMLPYPTPNPNEGCLETMLLPIAAERFPENCACVEAYCACTKTAEWTKKSSRDKMKLRCLLSASCPDNPSGGLPQFLKPEANLLPLNHSSLNELEYLLRNFSAWIDSAHVKWNDWRTAQAATAHP